MEKVLNIKIEILEENKDKYVLCATPKHGWAYNSLLFSGIGNSGYYPDINMCQLYTKEEVLKHAGRGYVPIKLSALEKKLVCHAEHAYSELERAKKEFEVKAND